MNERKWFWIAVLCLGLLVLTAWAVRAEPTIKGAASCYDPLWQKNIPAFMGSDAFNHCVITYLFHPMNYNRQLATAYWFWQNNATKQMVRDYQGDGGPWGVKDQISETVKDTPRRKHDHVR